MGLSSAFKSEEVVIPLSQKIQVRGNLNFQKNGTGLVIFAHGSGSSRFSPRNQHVAQILGKSHLSTLLIDLLTPQEEIIDSETSRYRFDIELLSDRLTSLTKWLAQEKRLSHLNIGYFGSSTGAAAAIKSAVLLGDHVKVVVSRGGRPDLAKEALGKLNTPVLFIVGGEDQEVIPLNEEACNKVQSHKRLEIIPGATHLFEEPGKLDEVAKLASEWFLEYL